MNKYKKDFPIFKHKHKGQSLVYLDSAATSQKPQVVINSVREFYETYNSNIHRGLYPIAEKATEKVEDVRMKVAKFINAKSPSEIVFTHGTTEGINILANDFSRTLEKDGEVIISEMEHHSNFVPWQRIAKDKKAKLLFFAINENGELTNRIVDEKGNVQYDKDFREMYHFDSLSLTHVSNVLGTINPIGEIIKKLEREVDPLFDTIVIDAAQSVPHMPIDVQKIGCSFMAFSGHKMLAPTGVGILYGRDGLLNNIDPLLYGSQMIDQVSMTNTTYRKAPERLESGTLPLENIIGLGAAIDYLNSIGMDKVRKHEKELTRYALEKMDTVEGLRVYGPKDTEKRSGVITFTIEGTHPHDIAQVLGDMSICIRAGHHCAMPLHKRLGIQATARVSFHIYSDEEDVDALIKGLKRVRKLFLV